MRKIGGVGLILWCGVWLEGGKRGGGGRGHRKANREENK